MCIEMSSPSTTGDNGRAPNGRFGAGNRIAKGNPHAQKVARLRSALFRAVKPSDLRMVVEKLVETAKAGDVPAIKELLQRLLGPPVESDLMERMEQIEKALEEIGRTR